MASLGMMRRFVLLLCLSSLASAGHFKYGTLGWKHLGMNSVEFTLESAWATDYGPYMSQGTGGQVTVGDVIRIQGLGNPVLEFGDGESAIVKARVTSVDPSLMVWVGTSTVLHQYPSPRNVTSGEAWGAGFTGCCRSDGLLGGGGGSPWEILSEVDLSVASHSPIVQLLPSATIRAGDNATGFYVSANDPGAHPTDLPSGSKLSWALTSATPPGFSVGAGDGLVTGGVEAGTYGVGVEVRDVTTNASSSVVLEVEVLAANATMPTFDASFPGTRMPYPDTNLVYAGFEVEFTLRFTVPGAATNITSGTLFPGATIRTAALPRGAAVGPVSVGEYAPPGSTPVKGYHALFTWTPLPEDFGWHAICIYLETNFSSPSPQTCFDFRVSEDPTPTWLTPPLDNLVATMGKELHITLQALDTNSADSVTIEGVDLPADAALTPADSQPRPEGVVTTRNLTWTPRQGSGGLRGQLCFRATDDGAGGVPGRSSASPADLCFSFSVPKCRYTVGEMEGLVEVARIFKTNWLQLWALNKDITRPEGYGVPGAVHAGFEVNVGQMVKVREGESLEKIVSRFGTTLRQTLGLNADITGTKPLVTGELVCLVPNSCRERS